MYHFGKLRMYHFGKLRMYHFGKLRMYHFGKLRMHTSADYRLAKVKTPLTSLTPIILITLQSYDILD